MSARDHLQQAADLVSRLRDQVRARDPMAMETLDLLRAETRAARADVADPAWRLGTHAPAIGDDLLAVQSVADALDDLSRNGVTPLIETASRVDLSTLAPRNGRFDLAPIQLSAARLSAADAVVRRVRDRVGAIRVEGLVAQVRSAVTGLQQDLRRASETTSIAARAATLLPPMLGSAGPRNYLVLFQNLAEVRATGGMPGAYVVIRADRGRVAIVDQGMAASDLRSFKKPVLPLRAADRALYTDKLGRFPANVNVTPDFPTTAALAREMYRRRSGNAVDGVFSTDPVALSYVLRALGPVPVPGGEPLTGDSAVPVLLSRIYASDVSLERQDRYFTAAARATFRALLERPVDPAALMGALVQAAQERRMLMWSTRAVENQLVAGTALAGVMPASDGADPTVGVFLNDGSGAKLGYYLTHAAEVAVQPVCRTDGRREITLRVVLGSTAPKSGLSANVLGMGLAGDPYTIRTNVSVYSPTGGAIAGMRLDGARQPFGAGRDRRRAVGIVTVDLKPGTRRTLDVTMLTGVPAGGYGETVTPRLWTTPGLTPWDLKIRSGSGCPRTR
ncbi:DUF4012 domain-containing protein [Actinoplanes sp. NPDC024001]|uniref:DUF4012 domain-containing protein n=1 Tax=Actinoplanes sp. NPDC024001 TaxID=3154598 RepID=UPI00340F42E8